MDVDEPVEIALGVAKRLGDCDLEDLRKAAQRLRILGTRNRAAADRMSAGEAPLCDGEVADGVFCENEATQLRTGGAGEGPGALCAVHFRLAEPHAAG